MDDARSIAAEGGAAGFGAASLLCAVAPTIELLVAARGLQGLFGALLTPSALAVIVYAFPPDERGRAIGSWTAWARTASWPLSWTSSGRV